MANIKWTDTDITCQVVRTISVILSALAIMTQLLQGGVAMTPAFKGQTANRQIQCWALVPWKDALPGTPTLAGSKDGFSRRRWGLNQWVYLDCNGIWWFSSQIYWFIYGCTGSLLLREGSLKLQQATLVVRGLLLATASPSVDPEHGPQQLWHASSGDQGSIPWP